MLTPFEIGEALLPPLFIPVTVKEPGVVASADTVKPELKEADLPISVKKRIELTSRHDENTRTNKGHQRRPFKDNDLNKNRKKGVNFSLTRERARDE